MRAIQQREVMATIHEFHVEADALQAIDCYAAMRQLWAYLDRELTDQTMTVVRKHLVDCAECYRHYQFAREFLAALGRVQSSRCAPHELRQRVMAALRAEGFEPRYDEHPSPSPPLPVDTSPRP